MIRSLHSAASGMEAQQLHIDVVANNLANVNTTGFKKSRVEFQDLFYQEIRAARRSEEASAQGAPAPLEVGQGTRPIATRKMFVTGDMIQTQNDLDLAIEGRGFFRIRTPDGDPAYTWYAKTAQTRQQWVKVNSGTSRDLADALPEVLGG